MLVSGGGFPVTTLWPRSNCCNRWPLIGCLTAKRAPKKHPGVSNQKFPLERSGTKKSWKFWKTALSTKSEMTSQSGGDNIYVCCRMRPESAREKVICTVPYCIDVVHTNDSDDVCRKRTRNVHAWTWTPSAIQFALKQTGNDACLPLTRSNI